MKLHKKLIAFYCIFVLSGFSGLVYESIWSHYLKLFLGHAAYAQALVLIVFMGGMALGAWIAAKVSHKIKNLLIAYALIEFVIGVLGLSFHNVFEYVINFSYSHAFPYLESKAHIHTYKWCISTLLILPQSILLGMTFPFMSNGIIRLCSEQPGRYISILYFCNSIGAAVGVLVAGFYFIQHFGLPGTILTAALLNIVLAITVYFIAKPLHISYQKPQTSSYSNKKWFYYLLTASFITGVASFIYQIAWIRMLSMVLGSSTHAFELMLSAFITGLALGGWYIRKYIDKLKNPVHTAGIIQIAMGILAALTIPLYGWTFDIMSFFLSALARNEQGYFLFNLYSHLISLLVMLPATFCAGMTLPLFTTILIQKKYGEKSVGDVYASNTVGAIIGVLFSVFIGMPSLGLKGIILVGSILDFVLGILLLVLASNFISIKKIAVASSIGIIIFSCLIKFSSIDVRRMAAGVYRTGQSSLDPDITPLAHYDGSTASISIVGKNSDSISIKTNGKTEASITINPLLGPTYDELTMVLLAAIPIASNTSANSIANIGFGSGLTTHTALLLDSIDKIDTIEIEPAIIEGAKFFKGKNDNAFNDKRHTIIIEDAKTYFHSANEKYDIIISEPSNPWVSGVSSLFTDEFYKKIKHYINDGGVLAQWIHTYENNIDIILPILKAISINFHDYQIYATNDADIVILASPDRALGPLKDSIFKNMKMKSQLEFIGVYNMHDLAIRFLGNKKTLGPIITSYPTINSDYYPVVDIHSSKARFIAKRSDELHQLSSYFVPINYFIEPSLEKHKLDDATLSKGYPASQYSRKAKALYHHLINNLILDEYITDLKNATILINMKKGCLNNINDKILSEALFDLNMQTVAYLHPEQLKEVYDAITQGCNYINIKNAYNILELYKSFSEKDLPNIAMFSEKILSSNVTYTPKQKEFIFASLLTSLITMEQYNAGLKAWEKYSRHVFQKNEIPFPVQLLYSMLVHNLTE